MANENKAMTAFAQAALAVSDLITQKFASVRFSGNPTRVVKVEAPNVPSTGGGKQARESIVLKPENGDAAGSVAIGFLDVGIRSCEIRSHAAVAMMFEQRHKARFDVPESEYDRFLQDLTNFLEAEGYVVKVVSEQTQAAKAARAEHVDNRAEGGSNNTPIFIAVGAALALVVIGAAVMFLR